MKYIYTLIIGLLLFQFFSAQIVISDTKTVADGDGLLDFDFPTQKGIALPKITSLDPGTVPGTLYFDTSDSKVKFMASTVVDLSVKSVPAENQYDITTNGYDQLEENATADGVVLGTETTNAPGVLVLESTEKALILPKVNSYLDIKGPEPGMLVYDLSKRMFCAYNGFQWSFWGK